MMSSLYRRHQRLLLSEGSGVRPRPFPAVSDFRKSHGLSISLSFATCCGHYPFRSLFPAPGSGWLFRALLCPQRPPSLTQECGLRAGHQRLHGWDQTPAGEPVSGTRCLLPLVPGTGVFSVGTMQTMPRVCWSIQ